MDDLDEGQPKQRPTLNDQADRSYYYQWLLTLTAYCAIFQTLHQCWQT